MQRLCELQASPSFHSPCSKTIALSAVHQRPRAHPRHHGSCRGILASLIAIRFFDHGNSRYLKPIRDQVKVHVGSAIAGDDGFDNQFNCLTGFRLAGLVELEFLIYANQSDVVAFVAKLDVAILLGLVMKYDFVYKVCCMYDEGRRIIGLRRKLV